MIDSSSAKDRVRVVGVGGSAGGIEAFGTILKALPTDMGMAFVFVLHLSPDRRSELTEVLSHWTRMSVLWARDGLEVRPNHLYVISPDTDLGIEDRVLRVKSPRTFTRRHHQVDHFFTALARARGSQAVGVILSGGDGDGAQGCRDIKAAGGTIIVQDDTARIGEMPRSAEFSGCADLVLSPIEIARKLTDLAGTPRLQSTG